MVSPLVDKKRRKREMYGVVVIQPKGTHIPIVNKKGLDVFGQIPDAPSMDSFECLHCGRTVVASRFAPHLERCMGLGRVPYRMAARR